MNRFPIIIEGILLHTDNNKYCCSTSRGKGNKSIADGYRWRFRLNSQTQTDKKNRTDINLKLKSYVRLSMCVCVSRFIVIF